MLVADLLHAGLGESRRRGDLAGRAPHPQSFDHELVTTSASIRHLGCRGDESPHELVGHRDAVSVRGAADERVALHEPDGRARPYV